MVRSKSEIKKGAELQSFLQTFNEIHPVLEQVGSISSVKSDKELEEVFLNVFQLHMEILGDLSIEFEIESDSLLDRVLRQKLSKELFQIISTLLKSDHKDGLCEESLKRKVLLIAKKLKTSGIENHVAMDPSSSDDLVFGIKTALLSGAVKFERYLGLVFENKFIESELEWLNQYTAYLAKDIAFNWSKKSNITDKERLFVSVMPCCSDLIIEAWFDEMLSGIEASNKSISYDEFWQNARELESALNQYSLGYAHSSIRDMEWLKQEVFNILHNSFKGRPIELMTMEKTVKFKSLFMRLMQKDAALTWKEFHDSVLSEIKKMTEAEYQEWLAYHAGFPVKLDGYRKAMDIKGCSYERLKKMPIDKGTVELKARSRMASLWGYSNAICKIKGHQNEK